MRFALKMFLVAALVAAPFALAEEDREDIESPFGVYPLEGDELFDGDPYVLTAQLTLTEVGATVNIDYENPALDDWTMELVFVKRIDPVVVDELAQGGSIRRKFAFEGEREGEDKIAFGRGDLRLRKTDDGTFRVTLRYNPGKLVIPPEEEDGRAVLIARFLGGGAGEKTIVEEEEDDGDE